MIQTRAYNGATLWIDSNKVVAVCDKLGSNNKPQCCLHLACGNETEEWIVNDDPQRILAILAEIEIRREAKGGAR